MYENKVHADTKGETQLLQFRHICYNHALL